MALTEEGLIHVPGISSRWIRLASGAKAHYVTAGETGPAIVLLHGGLAGSSGMAGWRFMLPFLAENGFRVYAPDRPGFGQAATEEEFWPKLGWKSYVEFVAQFVDALCLDKFFISGNSQGAQNAIFYMVNNPERILGAGLIGTAGLPAMMNVDPARLLPSEFRYPPFEGTKESMLAMMQAIIYRKDAVSDDLLEMRTRAGNAQADSLATARPANATKDPNVLQWQAVNQRLNKLTIPMIYLQGAKTSQFISRTWNWPKNCYPTCNSSTRMSAATKGKPTSRRCTIRLSWNSFEMAK